MTHNRIINWIRNDKHSHLCVRPSKQQKHVFLTGVCSQQQQQRNLNVTTWFRQSVSSFNWRARLNGASRTSLARIDCAGVASGAVRCVLRVARGTNQNVNHHNFRYFHEHRPDMGTPCARGQVHRNGPCSRAYDCTKVGCPLVVYSYRLPSQCMQIPPMQVHIFYQPVGGRMNMIRGGFEGDEKRKHSKLLQHQSTMNTTKSQSHVYIRVSFGYCEILYGGLCFINRIVRKAF